MTNNEPGTAAYKLKLYVCGMTPASELAVSQVCRIFEKEFTSPYELQIIDVLERPDIAERERVVATPMLIKEAPGPRESLIGDMSDLSAVRSFLGISLQPRGNQT
jgi:circadian clock protein KaiB